MRRIKRKKGGCARGILLAIVVVAIVMLAKGCLTGRVNDSGGEIGNLPTINSNAPATRTDLLILVNKDNAIPDGYVPNIADGRQYDEILLEDLGEMRDAARRDGTVLFVRDGYRTREEQEEIFNEFVSDYVRQGNSQNRATELASQYAALPGHSEHETGLAIDFSLADNWEESSKTWEWLANNAHKYGFILRYPEGKEDITGYSYEAWHYRYVGREHARAIYERGLVLEEYLLTL